MRIFVTGGNGFVGETVTRQLLRDGHDVVVGSRDGESVDGARGVRIDVTDFGSVQRAFGEVQPQGVVHLVGIIAEVKKRGQTFERVHFEGTRNVLAATAPGTRYVHMSALGARPDSKSGYSATKGRAEQIVRGSPLAWTILRPSLIFGPGDDFFGRVLRQLVSQGPVVPVIGDGGFLFRPVSVEDVALAFSRAFSTSASVGHTYDLTGPTEYRFDDLLRLELGALGKRKPLVHVPLALMKLAVPMMQILPAPPITRDQFAMLLEGSTADPTAARTTFDLPMLRLEDALPRILGAQSEKPSRAVVSGD
ncbi:complex I NDUFA9 subunit family protein [Deinococcus yavapaiensis]|uniref:NADH dehydrogenase n=1 Tax=Deinococcus yavapaiensis KR-236 TaxID=694435 RepID=A0A318SBB9_9DEIO|nr:complex I NDUFA9 subunit family protein [Deinococcus yavapaiensis]PYE54491.1 NADH dehydrogenase [Deinococcus yavapaiensis KR-236]